MSRFVWRRAAAIARKEIFHITRDPFTLGSALGLPIFMVVMFGVAIEFNVREIPLAVSDLDQTQSSRELIDTFSSSQYFIANPVESPERALQSVASQLDRAALVIPPGFQKDILNGRGGHAQLLLDGSDNSSVGPVMGYLTRIQVKASNRVNPKPKDTTLQDAPLEIRTRFLFNPELNSKWFVIPGLNVIVMAILSILLTSLTVAREYESGSMELLLSTPVQPLEIIIGKLAPYGGLGCLAILFVFIIARFIFDVPFVGNPLTFGLGCIFFLVAYLSQGLLISVIARNQQIAMQMAMMTGMLPSQLLSGFVFPIESMPPFFQYFTMILPARWFMRISRETFLKGTHFVDLWAPFLAIGIFCLVVIRRGSAQFKRDLEP